MSSKDKKLDAVARVANRVQQMNPKITHSQARRIVERALERSQRKKEQ